MANMCILCTFRARVCVRIRMCDKLEIQRNRNENKTRQGKTAKKIK